MSDALQIGILGDFNPDFRSHHATNAAVEHAARRFGLPVESRWLPTPSLLEPGVEGLLAACDGLWASSGSPYRSMESMLRAIEFARKRDWPFVGT